MRQLIRRGTPWLGLFAPLPVVAGAIVTATHYTGATGNRYSFFLQAISDLGDPSQSAWAGVFNAGMMGSGLCMALFIVGASRRVNTRPGYAIAAAGITATIAMMCIGVFTSHASTHAAHYVSAGIAFVGILALSAGFSLYMPFAQQDVLPKWLIAPSALSALCSTVFLALQVAVRTGRLDNSKLLFQLGTEGPLLHLMPTLEWAVLASVLLWCFATALSLLPTALR